MFESKPPEAPEQEDMLRELSWSDLVARLNAARDLRQHLETTADHLHPASFDVESASSIVHHPEGADKKAYTAVNQEISAYGKGNAGRDVVMTQSARGHAAEGPRRDTRGSR